MTEEELLAGVCMDDLPDQSLADMTAANAKIPVSVKDQGSYNIALAAVLESSKTDAQTAVAAHVAAVDPHAQYVRGTEIGETLCPLEGGVIPPRFFPASYDEVQYFDSLEDFPASGVDNVIYVSRTDGFTWRWGGEAYHRLNASLALGETADTAYPGNKGKVAYDHALAEGNPHRTTPADIGLGNVDNTNDLDKPVSTATSSAISTASTADRNRANHTGTQAASTISDFAATVRATVLTGLATGANAAIVATDTVLGGLAKLQAQITASLSTLNSHTGRTDNPHSVTKAQVGLGNVDNTKDLDKPVSTAMANALAGKEGAWGRGGISQSTDWNTVSGLGIYKVETTAFGPNGPTLPVNTWGVLTVIGFNNSLVQIYVPQAGPGSTFSQWCWRTYYDGVWCTWNSSYNSAYITSLFAGKQGLLTFDNAPTANSANPVTSNGVYDALLGKVSTTRNSWNAAYVSDSYRWVKIASITTHDSNYTSHCLFVGKSFHGGQHHLQGHLFIAQNGTGTTSVPAISFVGQQRSAKVYYTFDDTANLLEVYLYLAGGSGGGLPNGITTNIITSTDPSRITLLTSGTALASVTGAVEVGYLAVNPGYSNTAMNGSLVVGGGSAIIGNTHIGNWSQGSDRARFGHSSHNNASGFGFIQNSAGSVSMSVPAGQQIYIGVSGTTPARIDSSGFLHINPPAEADDTDAVPTTAWVNDAMDGKLAGKVDKVAIGGVLNYPGVDGQYWRGIAQIDSISRYSGGTLHVNVTSRFFQADVYLRFEADISAIGLGNFIVEWEGSFKPEFKIVTSGFKAYLYSKDPRAYTQTSVMNMELGNCGSGTLGYYNYSSTTDPGAGISPNYIQRKKLAFASTLTSDAQTQLDGKASAEENSSGWVTFTNSTGVIRWLDGFAMSCPVASGAKNYCNQILEVECSYSDNALLQHYTKVHMHMNAQGTSVTFRAETEGDFTYGEIFARHDNGGTVAYLTFEVKLPPYATVRIRRVMADGSAGSAYITSASVLTAPMGYAFEVPRRNGVNIRGGDPVTLPAYASVGTTVFVDGTDTGWSGVTVNAPGGTSIYRNGYATSASSVDIGAYSGRWFVKTDSTRWRVDM